MNEPGKANAKRSSRRINVRSTWRVNNSQLSSSSVVGVRGATRSTVIRSYVIVTEIASKRRRGSLTKEESVKRGLGQAKYKYFLSLV